MKKIFTFTFLLLLLQNINAQTIRDSVFNNIISINDTNVITNGNDFLIDIPIKSQKKTIIIFNSDRRIPPKLFFDRKSFLSEQNELFLITPDWEYYEKIIESQRNTGLHIKPVRQNKFYHIIRTNTNYRIDSLSIRMDEPRKQITLNFIKPELKKNEVKYYYIDCYGSSCCPRDGHRDFSKTIQEQIKFFEEKNNVLVTNDIYTENFGEEGEHCNHYPLSKLTNEQKLQFLQIFKQNDQLNNRIYLPIILSKNN